MAKKPTYQELQQRVKALEGTLVTFRQDKRKSEAIIESIGDGISIIDTDFKILYENKVHREIFGDYNGQNCYVAYRNRGQICEGCPAAATFKDGEIHTGERSLRTEKGVSYFEVTASPVRDSTGKITAAVQVVRDITERKRAEGALKDLQQLDEKILYGSPVAFVLHDRDLRIVRTSQAYKNVTGYDPDEVLGARLQDFMPDAPPKFKVIQGVKRVRDKGVQVGPRDIVGPSRKEKYLRETILPIFDSEGGVSHILSVLEDITERKRTELALREKERELTTKAKNLEEVNTALRVLLKQREEDKAELEKKVLSNVKHLVLPYVERLKKTSLGNNQISFVDILVSNLKEIISPFSRKLSSKYLGLTPTEIRVANLIKDDKTTKEIAEFMNLSEKTVETHRAHIRKKIGIKHKKVNLRTYLLSLQ